MNRLLGAHLTSRPGRFLLTLLLVALGTALVIGVGIVTRQIESRLVRDAAGIDLVVGAQGSPLQLVLAGVYHLDIPPGNIPLASLEAVRAQRWVAQAVPLALGDSYRGFRIVGTEPGYLLLKGGGLASGRVFAAPMEAVLGAGVARQAGLRVGSRFVGSHGLAPGGPEHDDDPYTVTGVLAPTGTVLDRLILTPLESVWLVHEGVPEDDTERRILEAEREVTLILVRYGSPLGAAVVPRAVAGVPGLQAASPAFESARLMQIAGFGTETLRLLGMLILAMAALSVFLALLQSLGERRRELALLRLLGASPGRIFSLLLFEVSILTGFGAVLGWLLAHVALSVPAFWVSDPPGWPFSGGQFDTIEAAQILSVIALGVLAALIPAWRAARVDLASELSRE